MMSNLPKDFKQKIYVHVGVADWNEGDTTLLTADISQHDKTMVCVGSFDAEFDLSAFSSDTNQKQIESLQAQKVKIMAEHHQAIKRIDDQIQSLQAIESK